MKSSRFLVLGILTVSSLIVLDASRSQIAYAKPIPLKDLSCMAIKHGGYGSMFNDKAEDIILNREIYTSLFRLQPVDQEWACKLPSTKSASLDLEMTIPSDDSGPFLMTIYLNGNQVVSEKIFPGKITLVKQPLTGRADEPYEVGGRRTLVLETTCLSGARCGSIRFLKGDFNALINSGARTTK
jgi:hypothetical protein